MNKDQRLNNRFKVLPTHGGDWEVVMQNHKGGRKAYLPRRLCLCTHADDAKAIAEAMDCYEREEPPTINYEYWEKRKNRIGMEALNEVDKKSEQKL